MLNTKNHGNSVFAWRHGGHVGGIKQRNGGHVGGILLGIKLSFYANSFFCFSIPIWSLVPWANTLYEGNNSVDLNFCRFLRTTFKAPFIGPIICLPFRKMTTRSPKSPWGIKLETVKLGLNVPTCPTFIQTKKSWIDGIQHGVLLKATTNCWPTILEHLAGAY